ncbi:MAG: DUF1573 domain-containing protein [Planctomycetes bacterium]|nr:DUF1573 domain-containing protein [Planctomycetota bacterium]
MKELKICLILIVLVVGFGFSEYTIAEEGANTNDVDKVEKPVEKPKISFEKQVYEFGKIYVGDMVTYKFKFQNVGKGELIINSVKTSCGCTAALVSKDKLLSNECGEIDVKFKPGKFVGKVSKTVTVNSNDPETPTYKLTISGDIIEEVVVNPRRINFGTRRKGDSVTKTLEIKTLPGLNTQVTKVESPSPYITISKEKDGADGSCVYQITFNNYDYIGSYSGIVFVYTTSARQERIDVPFSGDAIGDLTFYPEVVSFGNIKQKLESKRTVIINLVNSDVKIEKVEAHPDFIKHSLSDLNKKSKRLEVSLSDNRPVGKITGGVKIYTTSSVQPVISIPINGEIKE